MLAAMSEVTARLRASLSARSIPGALILPAEDNAFSNKTLVSAPWFAQFSRGYIRGYDRDHLDSL
jgi:hypothetical protein